MELSEATTRFIQEHAQDDVRALALRAVPAGVDLRAALTQIEGRRLASHKLPTWAATDGLLYPPRLALEQCSSEATASYKRSLVKRLLSNQSSTFIARFSPLDSRRSKHSFFFDLTGGLGVDFSAMAPLFSRAIYVERQETLCELARHNLPLLGIGNAEVWCRDAGEVLRDLSQEPFTPAENGNPTSGNDSPVRFLMIDPARRDTVGHKVALIKDCTPDVCALQAQLRSAADYTLIKLSPMLDLTAAIRALHGVVEVHVVSMEGECKELLLVMGTTPDSFREVGERRCEEVPIYCVDLSSKPVVSPTDFSPFLFTRASEAMAPLILADTMGAFLYEPNASILKAGAFRSIGQHYALRKLATDTHLYTSDRPILDFPGRRWHIVDSATFAKHDLRRLLSGITSADLTVRGFPVSVASLRKQLRLREGGTTHFIATTLANQRLLLRVERL